MSEDTDTIWTDGSRLEDGRVGAGIAWFEREKRRKGKLWSREGTAGRRGIDARGVRQRTREDTGP